MKNLYAFLMAAMLLFTLPGAGSHSLPAGTSSVNDLGQAQPLNTVSGGTVIHFFDPNFEAAVRALIGKPEGDILAGDVAKIIELDVNELDITDLTGIEYFTALEVLSCDDNQLTTLNVSRNPALIKLFCTYNQLTMLDVSQNPVLEELGCGSNQLMMLDVSQNTALKELFCWDNQLTTLDVSHNIALKELFCADNQLTTLDVSHNIALVRLICHHNLMPNKSAIIGLDENRPVYLSFDLQKIW